MKTSIAVLTVLAVISSTCCALAYYKPRSRGDYQKMFASLAITSTLITNMAVAV
jgi:heme/copper-type cytochrome/quinol oxidase subunit 3